MKGLKNKVKAVAKEDFDVDIDTLREIKKEFVLYSANSRDQTYKRNWNNFENWSMSLIISLKNFTEGNASNKLMNKLNTL